MKKKNEYKKLEVAYTFSYSIFLVKTTMITKEN